MLQHGLAMVSQIRACQWTVCTHPEELYSLLVLWIGCPNEMIITDTSFICKGLCCSVCLLRARAG
jgi:hypothetical protein